jgi:hypothetical protein
MQGGGDGAGVREGAAAAAQPSLLRALKRALIDAILAVTRLLLCWLPGGDAERGRALFAAHAVAPIAGVLLFFALPLGHRGRLLLLLAALLVAASQWAFRGCVITKAEQLLTGEDATIVDAFLRLAALPAARDTRLAATVASSTAVAGVMAWSFVWHAG